MPYGRPRLHSPDYGHPLLRAAVTDTADPDVTAVIRHRMGHVVGGPPATAHAGVAWIPSIGGYANTSPVYPAPEWVLSSTYLSQQAMHLPRGGLATPPDG